MISECDICRSKRRSKQC